MGRQSLVDTTDRDEFPGNQMFGVDVEYSRHGTGVGSGDLDIGVAGSSALTGVVVRRRLEASPTAPPAVMVVEQSRLLECRWRSAEACRVLRRGSGLCLSVEPVRNR
nr:hypothetical protein [Kibdelosporangium sp. MJ126-NF4]CTQ88440.1 hypothetical protein [Kibdelosporangium sp. MJ126-NF4]